MAENSVSYSQFSMYLNCPKKWEQEYVLNKRVFTQSIHTIFGTAMHEVLQNYLTVMYDQTAKKADEIDLSADLRSRMAILYKEAADKTGHFSTAEELHEFWLDGVQIIDYFKSKRSVYFSSRHHELLGIETALDVPLNKNLKFRGFIDVVIKDKRDGTIQIIDLKTSTRGWNKWQKADKTKTAQLLLYKEFYAKQFDVDVDLIEVDYIILRRKISEDYDFPMKRIQTFSPASGKPSRNKVGASLLEFIDVAFNDDGTYNTETEHIAKAHSGCKYCKYKNDPEICPVAKRIKG